MAGNIFEEYIKLTKEQIKEYMKMVLERNYKAAYCELFLERYINIRYYNYYENEFYESTRRKILEHFKMVSDEIAINNIEDREIIEIMRVFFYYVLYFDNVVYYKDLRTKISQIAKSKKRVFKKEIARDFEENLYQIIVKYMNQKEDLLKKYESDKFYLKLTNYPDKLRVYRVNLKFNNIKFPLEYSDFAINKAFQTGLIGEDRLVVEYNLIALQILKDILKLNFKKKYILEFAESLLSKPKKIKSVLSIINNSAIQDKISLKIKYEEFVKNKEIVYEIMRDGFRITIILDNSFEANFRNVESLKMFDFVIINSNLKHYEDIMSYKENICNLIEI